MNSSEKTSCCECDNCQCKNQLPPLDKCCDCQKPFNLGEKHRAIRKEKSPVMNFCLACWNKYSYEEEKWEN